RAPPRQLPRLPHLRELGRVRLLLASPRPLRLHPRLLQRVHLLPVRLGAPRRLLPQRRLRPLDLRARPHRLEREARPELRLEPLEHLVGEHPHVLHLDRVDRE
ncbi:MAG: hypothetical protein ACK559_32775, partial [bacterium]